MYHLVTVNETQAKMSKFEFMPVINEFPQLLPEELPGIPPDMVIDFGIDVWPDTNPISIPPYHMAPVELQELKDLLDKGFTRPST